MDVESAVTNQNILLSQTRELGSPPSWGSKCKIKIKTLAPLKSPKCELFNSGKVLILILHFDTQNG